MGAISPGLEYKSVKKSVKKETREYFQRAASLCKAQKFNEAEQFYLAAVRQGETFYGGWGRAWCAWQLQDLRRANQLFQQNLSVNDSLAPFLADYLRFAAEELKQWQLVEDLARRLYRVNPADEVLLNLLDYAERLQTKALALGLFAEFVKQYPKRDNARLFYAVLLQDLGQGEKAAKVAKSVAALSRNPYHLKLVVWILAQNGQYLSAARVAEKMSELTPRSAHTLEAWGFLEYKQGDYTSAAEHYQKALNRDYRIPTMLMLARLYLFHLDNPAKVKYYCQAVLQHDRQNSDAYYFLAENARRKGDFKTAIKYSARLIELLPNHPQAYYYHGKLLYATREYSQAVVFLEKAVQANKEMRRYRLVLAKAYAAAGMVDKAQLVYHNYLKEPLKELWQEEEMLKEAPTLPR
jgi:tetratricopeptide (TPR) repeat protein